MASAQKRGDKRAALDKVNDFNFDAHEQRVGLEVLQQNQKAHHDRVANLGGELTLVTLKHPSGNVLKINAYAKDDIATWKKQGYVEAGAEETTAKAPAKK